MAQHSHVPEFGNWENDNIPYTAYFEKARKVKGGVMINPNDHPEENPEAFMYMGRGGLEMTADYPAVQAPNHLHVDSSTKSVSPEEKQHIDQGHTSHRSHRRNPSDLQKNGSPRIIEFESGSSLYRSKSDYSLMQQPSYRRKRSDNKKTPAADGVDSFSSTVAGHGRQRSLGSYSSVEIVNDLQHRRGASSIPKFGAWNEADPKSGEGFTVIFNRLKEEKQTETSHFPVVQQQQPNYHSNTERHERSSPRLKICCCLFSSGSE